MQAFYAQKQEEMFRKAREQMEKEMKENPDGMNQRNAHYDQALYAQQQSARFQVLENEVNLKASVLTKEYMRTLPAET